VLELLRQRPRPEALAIFEHIRRGDNLEVLLKTVSDGDMLLGFSSTSDFRPVDQDVEGTHVTDARKCLDLPLITATMNTMERQ
jgi:hypothetical protein